MAEFLIHLRAIVEAENAADAESRVIGEMDNVPAEIHVDKVVTIRSGALPRLQDTKETDNG